MAKRTGSKADAQLRHAKRRASERYGIVLNQARYEDLVKKIQNQEGVFLGRQSNRLSVWQIEAMAVGELGDEAPVKANVVYDSQRKTIVTFLPKGITNAWGVELEVEAPQD